MAEDPLLDRLPHQPPLRLVDEIVHVRAGESIEARVTFAPGAPVFAGHFPGAPVVPGVYLIEAVAQAAALLVLASLPPSAPEVAHKLPMLAGVERARFRRPAYPGQLLTLRVSLAHSRASFWKFTGGVWRGGEEIASMELLATMGEIAPTEEGG